MGRWCGVAVDDGVPRRWPYICVDLGLLGPIAMIEIGFPYIYMGLTHSMLYWGPVVWGPHIYMGSMHSMLCWGPIVWGPHIYMGSTHSMLCWGPAHRFRSQHKVSRPQQNGGRKRWAVNAETQMLSETLAKWPL